MSSEWSGPTPIAQEYPKGNIESNGIRRLVNMVTDLRRDLRESTSNLLSTAGIFLSRTGMRIASSLTVDGDLTSTGAADITGTTHIGGATTIDGSTTIDDTLHIGGATDIDGTLNVDAATTIGGNTTIGGTLGVTGVTTLGAPTTVSGTLGVTGVTTLGAATSVTGALNVSGPMAVTGTLSLPAGIIDNAALASPVTGDVGNNYVLTAVTSSWANYAGVSIAVPAGFTRAQVMAVSSVIGPTTDTWQIRVDIAGVTGAEYTVFGNNGALGFAHNLTGLSGGSITVATGVRNAVASGNNRGIATSATVTFLR